jgi:hypothetical protein
VEYDCRVTCSASASSEPVQREEMEGELSAVQLDHLMAVIAGMESVRAAGSGSSPPPSDEELRQFLDYMGQGTVNQQRVDFDAAARDQPEPPKRSKTAQQYFWRRHYLSIIQEDEEDHDTPLSSRPASRPGSTYENSLAARLASRLGALSPLCSQSNGEGRAVSWGSEASCTDSIASINSILSEEGSITSTGSFQSEPVAPRVAPPGLSCLLELVQPPPCTPDSLHPSRTPDSMSGRSACASPTGRPEEEPTALSGAAVIKPMGSKFKQQIRDIEEARQKGKGWSSRVCVAAGGVSSVSPPGPARPAPPLSPPGEVTRGGGRRRYWSHAYSHVRNVEQTNGSQCGNS